MLYLASAQGVPATVSGFPLLERLTTSHLTCPAAAGQGRLGRGALRTNGPDSSPRPPPREGGGAQKKNLWQGRGVPSRLAPPLRFGEGAGERGLGSERSGAAHEGAVLGLGVP